MKGCTIKSAVWEPEAGGMTGPRIVRRNQRGKTKRKVGLVKSTTYPHSWPGFHDIETFSVKLEETKHLLLPCEPVENGTKNSCHKVWLLIYTKFNTYAIIRMLMIHMLQHVRRKDANVMHNSQLMKWNVRTLRKCQSLIKIIKMQRCTYLW
jgi:hypothetical protein